jgi:Protein of unknown function (DUF2968)
MSHISRMRGTALAALVTIGGLSVTGCVSAQLESPNNAAAAAGASAPVVAVTPAAPSALPVPAASPDQAAAASAMDEKEAQGNVAELQRMIHSSDLAELRTSYNGSYGASLLLYGKEMTYYVVLFQQKSFWRVVKTQDDGRAEAVYADFVRKSEQLADIEVRRAKLAAQKAYTESLIELAQQRADRLQADIDVAHQQQTVVAGRQKQAREEAAALETQKQAAQEQLRSLRHQVRMLQDQDDQGLPPLRMR